MRPSSSLLPQAMEKYLTDPKLCFWIRLHPFPSELGNSCFFPIQCFTEESFFRPPSFSKLSYNFSKSIFGDLPMTSPDFKSDRTIKMSKNSNFNVLEEIRFILGR